MTVAIWFGKTIQPDIGGEDMKRLFFRLALAINYLALCGTASAGQAVAPQPGGGLGFAALKLVFGLAAVVGMMLAALYVFKKFMAGRGIAVGNERLLKVASAVPVGMKSNIVLLDFMDSYLLVGVTDGAMTLLSRFEKAPGQKDAPDLGDEFSKSLEMQMKKAGSAYMEAAASEEAMEMKPAAKRRGRPPKYADRRPVLTAQAAPAPKVEPLPAVALILKQKLERIRAAI